MKAATVVTLITFATATKGHSQVVQPHRFGPNVNMLRAAGNLEKADWLTQAGLTFSDAVPRVSIQAFTYYLGLSDNSQVPFYILTALPLQSDTTNENAVNSLLDEFGGLLNISFGPTGKTTPFGWFKFADPNDGMFYDIRIESRGVETEGSLGDVTKVPLVGTAFAQLKLALPIFAKKPAAGDPGNRAGNLVFVASGMYSTVFANKLAFQTAFPTADRSFGNLNVSAALVITEWLYLAGGGTLWSSEGGIDGRWYFQMSFLGQDK